MDPPVGIGNRGGYALDKRERRATPRPPMTAPETLPADAKPRLRRRWRVPARIGGWDTAAASFWLLLLLTLAAELATGQSWYNLLGETIYNAFSLKAPGAVGLFAATLAGTHLAVLGGAFLVARRLFGRRSGSALLGFHVLLAGLACWAALLLVRKMALTYAAELPDVEQLRSLAGGHLLRGLVYVRLQLLLLLAGAVGAAAIYVLLRLALRFDPAPPTRGPRAALVAAVAAATVALLFASARVPEVRDALAHFATPRLALRGLDAATDFDRDGYGLFASPPDDAPFDASRHPFALDVPDDGIDQDGLGGDFHYRGPLPALAPAAPSFPGRRRHVILIVLESTRADAIGGTWRGSPITPNLNALAVAGTASPEGYSNQAETGDSMKVIFGGDVPPILGGTIFSDFRNAGYRVGIFSGSPEDWGDTATTLRLRETSDIFVDASTLQRPGAPRAAVPVADPEDVLRAFDRAFGDPGRWTHPNFLYFNVRFPHFPYEQPGTRQMLPGRPLAESEISEANRALVRGAYWNAVANADRVVGELIGRLKALGVYQDCVLVAVGDHGEELFEDGHLGHGLMLDPRTTRVPFIVSLPGFALPRPVGHTSLRALLLRAAGADVPLPPDGPIFQFLGPLDRPSIIGMTEAGGRMTTLSLRDGHVVSTAPAAAARYASLPPGSWLRTRADRVVGLWARARWEHRLRAERTPRQSASSSD
jgi:hypothetical protein